MKDLYKQDNNEVYTSTIGQGIYGVSIDSNKIKNTNIGVNISPYTGKDKINGKYKNNEGQHYSNYIENNFIEESYTNGISLSAPCDENDVCSKSPKNVIRFNEITNDSIIFDKPAIFIKNQDEAQVNGNEIIGKSNPIEAFGHLYIHNTINSDFFSNKFTSKNLTENELQGIRIRFDSHNNLIKENVFSSFKTKSMPIYDASTSKNNIIQHNLKL